MRGAAVGGYGEAILNAPIGNSQPTVIDLRRTVLFLVTTSPTTFASFPKSNTSTR